MNIYFSGIGGVGIGPLAKIAHDAGHTIVGSDITEGLVTRELRADGIEVEIGQDGRFLEAFHKQAPIDWFVYTSALPRDHPELTLATSLGIRTSKRDEFLAYFLEEHNFKLIAVSGTHGKTTTTGMLVWVMKQLGIPVSYSVGSTLTFGPSGAYDPESDYFVYECDEYDRNFLHFTPHLSLVTSVDYDHPDTYPTKNDYTQAFTKFLASSDHVILWNKDAEYLALQPNDQLWILEDGDVPPLKLTGQHNRQNGQLVLKALEYLRISVEGSPEEALAQFPGTDRRFERLADNLYSDYGHNPVEIAATLELARELSDNIMLVYQPHQNQRQHLVKHLYTDVFEGAQSIYWLPTYLSREDPAQTILSPETLTATVTNRDAVHYADLDDALWDTIQKARERGVLVLCMGAGTIDDWVREKLASATA
jgi:UDP-N-acetylmuramate--alanine ligase